ncbi:ATP-grasp domain-containing protein [Saccharicrinis fermentans]|nr:ATP-grasp domain-containing protein [Saccharicrinis fermentans]
MPALFDHVSFIQTARENNYQVITCDNNPNNIGHKYADQSVNINLLDFEELANYVERGKVDAVAAFSTDIGAVAAAFVADNLNLVGNPVKAVKMMANKKEFRLFLYEHGFNSPFFQAVASANELSLDDFRFPIIIKPTDRAGSKGVFILKNKCEIQEKIAISLDFSLEHKVIVEEFIVSEMTQIHGDAMVQNGKLLFCCLGDQYFGDGLLRFSPIGTLFPSSLPEHLLEKVKNELQRFIDVSSYRNGGINIELKIDQYENVYFIELAPRFGGNYIPMAIECLCNLNVVKYAFDIAVGRQVSIPSYRMDKNVFQFILRSYKEGVFKSVEVRPNRFFRILQSYPIKQVGDTVDLKDVSSSIISVFILQAEHRDVFYEVMNCTNKYFCVTMVSNRE